MQVAEVMSRNVHYCRRDQQASDAASAMWELDIGCIPIVDATGTPIGMVTDRDLCMAACLQNKALHQFKIEEAMSKEVFSCRATDSVVSAGRTMEEHQVRRLPVVDDAGKLVGMLSLNDIVLSAQSPLGRTVSRLRRGRLGQTIEAVSRHRTPPRGAQL